MDTTEPTIASVVADASRQLAAAGIDSHHLDSELLAAHVLGRSRTWLLTHSDEPFSPVACGTMRELVARRAAREPLVHLTGTRDFYGLELGITRDVLTPRVETEQMVEWALAHTKKNGTVIDIGTGSGAIAIALAHHRPDLTVTATEVSLAALEVARDNATRHHTAITFIASDLWDHIEGRYDTVVTNLPYLRDDARAELMTEVTHEPSVALFGGSDGLELYRRFLTGIAGHLEDGGYLFTECDPWQHEALIAEAAPYGLEPVEQGYFILGFRYTKKRA